MMHLTMNHRASSCFGTSLAPCVESDQKKLLNHLHARHRIVSCPRARISLADSSAPDDTLTTSINGCRPNRLLKVFQLWAKNHADPEVPHSPRPAHTTRVCPSNRSFESFRIMPLSLRASIVIVVLSFSWNLPASSLSQGFSGRSLMSSDLMFEYELPKLMKLPFHFCATEVSEIAPVVMPLIPRNASIKYAAPRAEHSGTKPSGPGK